MSTDSQEREAFEAWCVKERLSIDRRDGPHGVVGAGAYRDDDVAWLWEGWQARAVIEADRSRQVDEIDALKRQIAEWVAANGPGGWIDDLRRKLAQGEPPLPPDLAWRDHQAAIDSKALATATEIALMWGQDRSQFVSRIQVAVIDAMLWLKGALPAAASQFVQEEAPYRDNNWWLGWNAAIRLAPQPATPKLNGEAPSSTIIKVHPAAPQLAQLENHDSVRIPIGEDEAAMMVLLGTNWLKAHAPGRLAQPRGEPDSFPYSAADLNEAISRGATGRWAVMLNSIKLWLQTSRRDERAALAAPQAAVPAAVETRYQLGISISEGALNAIVLKLDGDTQTKVLHRVASMADFQKGAQLIVGWAENSEHQVEQPKTTLARMLKFLDAAAGEGFVLNEVDAADLFHEVAALATPPSSAVKVCCQDFEKCREMCVSRADFWQGQCNQLRRAATVELSIREALIELYGMAHADGVNPSDEADVNEQRMATAINLTLGRISLLPKDSPGHSV